MQNQAPFSSKDKSKKLKCRLLQFLFGALRVNPNYHSNEKYFYVFHQGQICFKRMKSFLTLQFGKLSSAKHVIPLKPVCSVYISYVVT